jgi:hypothetical protein
MFDTLAPRQRSARKLSIVHSHASRLARWASNPCRKGSLAESRHILVSTFTAFLAMNPQSTLKAERLVRDGRRTGDVH